jgi:uncharacterized protein DUF4350
VSAPFQPRSTVLVIGVGALSLSVAVALWVFGPEPPARASAQADTYSVSAVGHRAFLEVLRALRVPVVVSRFDSGRRAGGSAVLFLAEPRVDGPSPATRTSLPRMLASAATVVLVLPKWEVREDERRRGHVAAATLIAPARVDLVLQAAGLPARIRRGAGEGTIACAGAREPVALRRPQYLHVDPGRAEARVTCPEGVLVTEFQQPAGRRVLVLSDPDVLSNHGLGQAGNASLAVQVVEAARQGTRTVVVDETLHGHVQPPSLWRDLLAPPLLPPLLLAMAAGAVFAWAGVRRFGDPLPPEPELAPGKAALIENTAVLLQLGGHSVHTLGRYLETAAQDVARAVHLPAADAATRGARLSALGRLRGVKEELRALEDAVRRLQAAEWPAPAAVLAVGRRVHRWREEMLRGDERSRLA